MSATDLIQKFESERATIQEKLSALQDRDAFLEKVLAEMRKASFGKAAKTKRPSRSRKAKTAATSKKSGRRKPVRAKVSASEADLQLLAGSKKGHSASEIISQVTEEFGYRANSLRTTLYNLKKAGTIVQEMGRNYNRAANLG